MTATEKLAHKRLTLLQLAERLGNISKACLMHKVSRSQFTYINGPSRSTVWKAWWTNPHTGLASKPASQENNQSHHCLES
jgi:hypothetical protein